MPEGDSVWKLARRMRAGLVGRTVVGSDFRVPQHATADLSGREVLAFASRGKNMLTRFSAGADGVPLTLHTHLEMDGAWQLVGPGKALPRALDDEVRLVLRTDGPTAYALRMPVLTLLPTSEEHRAVGHLGPDLLGDDWDESEAVSRLSADPDRPLVEALLDQRSLAGIGNLWAVETCYLRGHSPWTPVRDVDLAAAVRLAQRMMRHSLDHPGQVTTGDTRRGRTHWVYGRADRPCRRCGTPVQFRDAVEGHPYGRETWWCPSCQPGPAPSLAERPTRPGLRRGVNEESFGSRGRRLRGEAGYSRARRA
ncbi:MAG TPA: DNA-formamidopyrimidine glycosylase family protein [Mycobacteriales bacterium]|nr:DNA-formamidopyrimidine glycosylase family protein [Mycobacteriales bacterium]